MRVLGMMYSSGDLLFLLILSLPVSVIDLTITRSALFKGFRQMVASKSEMLGELVSCPFCMSFWLSFAVIAIFGTVVIPCSMQHFGALIQFFASSFTLVAFAMPVSMIIFKSVDKITG